MKNTKGFILTFLLSMYRRKMPILVGVIEEKTYKCSKCGRIFSSLQAFSAHSGWCGLTTEERKERCKKRMEFSGKEKPYKCFICNRLFATNTELLTHQMRRALHMFLNGQTDTEN